VAGEQTTFSAEGGGSALVGDRGGNVAQKILLRADALHAPQLRHHHIAAAHALEQVQNHVEWRLSTELQRTLRWFVVRVASWMYTERRS